MNESLGIVQSTYYGGDGDDYGRGIGVESGNVILAGDTNSTSFPFVTGSLPGGRDVFVTKLTPNVTGHVATRFIGGSGAETASGLALDSAGNAYVTGAASRNLVTTANAYQTRFGGGETDGFVAKVIGTGWGLGYVTYVGGSGDDQPTALAVDSEGSVYLTGSTGSADYPTVNPLRLEGVGAFVSKLNSSGGDLVYSTTIGSDTQGVGIGVDAWGQAIVTGSVNTNSDIQIVNRLQDPNGYNSGGFLSRLNPQGQAFIYSTYLGGSGVGAPSALAVDAVGTAYVAGSGVVAKVLPTLSPNAAPMLTGISGDTVGSAFDLYTASSGVTLRGLAAPGETVKVSRADGSIVGTTAADSAGIWTMPANTGSGGTFAFTVSRNQVPGLNNRPSAPLLVNVDQTAPSVTLEAPTLTPVRQPEVRVLANDFHGLPDGSPVWVDVTVGGTTTTLVGGLRNGVAVFRLPDAGPGSLINVRARVRDQAGNEGQSPNHTITITQNTIWQIQSAVVRNWDVDQGDPLMQTGNVQVAVDLDLDRSPGRNVGLNPQLVYNSDSVNARPVIQATLSSDNTQALPPVLRAVLTWDGIPQAEVQFSTAGYSPGQELILALQPSSPISRSGRFVWSLQVLADYQGASSNVLMSSPNATTFAVRQDDSAFGPGWTFSLTDRLIPILADSSGPAGQLRAYGTGGWRFYQDMGVDAFGVRNFASPAGDPGILKQQTDSTFEYRHPSGKTEKFNAAGYQTSIVSTDLSETVSFTYNGSNLATMATPDGAVTTFVYDVANTLITSIQAPNRAVVLEHLGGNLASITPANDYHSFEYNPEFSPEGHLTSWVQGSGLTGGKVYQSWTYTNGMARSQKNGLGGEDITLITPAAAVGLGILGGVVQARSEDALGRVTIDTLDLQGRLLRRVAADGSVTSWGRNANGWVTSATDPLNRVTTYQLDNQGYVTQTTLPDGTTRISPYEPTYHNMTSLTDERGKVTSYGYDTNGRQTSVTDAENRTTTYSYYTDGAQAGLLKTMTDALDRTTTYEYDSQRILTAVIDPLLPYSTIYTYSDGSFTEAVRDRRNFVTTFTYDSAGRLILRKDPFPEEPFGQEETWEYYPGSGLLKEHRDARDAPGWTHQSPSQLFAAP